MNTHESGFVRNRHGDDLFVHYMQGDTDRLWMFCPPLLEEATFCRSGYQELALLLNGRGDSILQFDYAGTGDSTGTMHAVTLDTMVQDAADLMTFIGHDPAMTLAFGLRMGANIAMRLAARHQGMQVLAWLPIEDGPHYLDSLLRYNLVTQLAAWSSVREKRDELHARLAYGGSVNVLGYTLPSGLTATLRTYRLSETRFPPGLVLLNKSAHSSLLIRNLATPGCELREVNVKPFWHEPRHLTGLPAELIGPTLSCLAAEECV